MLKNIFIQKAILRASILALILTAAVPSALKAATSHSVNPFSLNLIAPDLTLPETSDQKRRAFLINGTYDFAFDDAPTMGFTPHLAGGLGLAGEAPASLSSSDTTPIFQLGGGISYRLGPQWNLSLDYQARFTGGLQASERNFTGRSQEPLDLQTLNMGMSLKF